MVIRSFADLVVQQFVGAFGQRQVSLGSKAGLAQPWSGSGLAGKATSPGPEGLASNLGTDSQASGFGSQFPAALSDRN